MGKFDPYKIVLKSLDEGTYDYSYDLDDEYFKKIDSPEVQRGMVKAHVTVKNTGSIYEIHFQLDGNIIIPCDRCLDDMEFPINQKSRLIVKLGKAYAEESDEIIIIPEDEGEINIAWFLYEFIVLSIPIKHVHAPGKCNKMMTSKLRKHMAWLVGDEDDMSSDSDIDISDDEDIITESEDERTDPRWDDLKNIMDNN